MTQSTAISDIMSRDLIIVEQSELLYKFKRDFSAKRIHHILVENQFDKLVGIISLDDVLRAENFSNEYNISAADLMTADPIVINQNQSVNEAISLFLDNKYRALPVVDDNEKLVGIITPYDIIEANYKEH